VARQFLFPFALLSVVPVTFAVLFSMIDAPESPTAPKAKATVTEEDADADPDAES
jgi:hypothetical protein